MLSIDFAGIDYSLLVGGISRISPDVLVHEIVDIGHVIFPYLRTDPDSVSRYSDIFTLDLKKNLSLFEVIDHIAGGHSRAVNFNNMNKIFSKVDTNVDWVLKMIERN